MTSPGSSETSSSHSPRIRGHGFLDRWIPEFSVDGDLGAARQYLMTFGVFHMSVRLALILSRKGDGSWWDHDYCLAGDKVGVTAQAGSALCQKAARWAARAPGLKALMPWFSRVGERIEALWPECGDRQHHAATPRWDGSWPSPDEHFDPSDRPEFVRKPGILADVRGAEFQIFDELILMKNII